MNVVNSAQYLGSQKDQPILDDNHDDLRILNNWIIPDDEGNAKYIIDHIQVEEEPGCFLECVKVIRLCRLWNVPRSIRESKALMNYQSEMLEAIWHENISFITLYCNILEPKPVGHFICYGIQVTIPVRGDAPEGSDGYLKSIESAKEIAKEQADINYEALISLLEGNYRQCQFRLLKIEEMQSIYDTMVSASNLSILRGIPKTHISSGNSVTEPVTGTTSTPDAFEQNEELLRGMSDKQYALLVMASPIPKSELVREAYKIAEEYGTQRSQLQGSNVQTIGMAFPMSIMGNINTTLGFNSGVSEAEGQNLGTAHGISENTTHTIGNTDTFSHNNGISHTMNQGSADNYTQGYNQGYAEGHSSTTTQGDTVGKTHTAGHTQTHSVGASQTNTTSSSSSVGTGSTATVGSNWGNNISNTTGNSQGMTNTLGVGSSDGTGTSLTNTHSQGASDGYSNSVNQSDSTTSGTSQNYTAGQNWGTNSSTGGSYTNGFSTNQGTSFTQNDSNSASDTTGHATANTTGISNTSGLTNTSGVTDTSGSSHTSGTADTTGSSTGQTIGNSSGNSYTYSNNNSNTSGISAGASAGVDFGVKIDASGNLSNSNTTGDGVSIGTTATDSASTSTSSSQAHTNNSSDTTSQAHSVSSSTAISNSQTNSNSISNTNSSSHSAGHTTGTANGVSSGQGNSTSNGVNYSSGSSQGSSVSNSWGINNSASHSAGTSQGHSSSTNFSDSTAQGTSSNHSNSQSKSVSNSQTQTASHAAGSSTGGSMANANSNTFTNTSGRSQAYGTSWSDANAISESIADSVSKSLAHAKGLTNTMSVGENYGTGKTFSNGIANGTTETDGVSHANSNSIAKGNGTTDTTSQGVSTSKGNTTGSSTAYGTGMGANMGVAPNIGFSKVFQTWDGKRELLVQLLEQQKDRFHRSTINGAFYVDVFGLAGDAKAAAALSALARSAFGGESNLSNIQVVTPRGWAAEHLLKHAMMMTPCTQPEYCNVAEGYRFSSVLLTSELAAYTHIPRVEAGGTYTTSQNIPPFTLMPREGEIYLGKQISCETGRKTLYPYNISQREFMHCLISGASGTGKTKTALRITTEIYHKLKNHRILALDWKADWRSLSRIANPDDFAFYNLDTNGVNTIAMNVYLPPKHINIMQWRDRVHESLCLAYGFGNRQKAILDNTVMEIFKAKGVLVPDERDIPQEASDAIEKVCKITLADVYAELQAIRAGMGSRGGTMADAYDSLLDKLYNYAASNLKGLYCETDPEKIVHIEDLVNGKRIVVLEGGDLDEMSKKFIISLISWGVFMYTRARKSIEGIVEEIFFVLEEAHRIITDTSGSNGNSSPYQVSEDIYQIMFNEARAFGLYLMPIVQTPSHLPANVIANCQILIVHRLAEEKDVQQMTLSLARNARIDDRDVPLFLEKMPRGQALIRINNQPIHQMSEPILVAIEEVIAEPPSDHELVCILDIDAPERLLNTTKYFSKSDFDFYLDDDGDMSEAK